jgi:hypothetical protein
MLEAGNSSASRTSCPEATIGVGHSASSFRAAEISVLILNSSSP